MIGIAASLWLRFWFWYPFAVINSLLRIGPRVLELRDFFGVLVGYHDSVSSDGHVVACLRIGVLLALVCCPVDVAYITMNISGSHFVCSLLSVLRPLCSRVILFPIRACRCALGLALRASWGGAFLAEGS